MKPASSVADGGPALLVVAGEWSSVVVVPMSSMEVGVEGVVGGNSLVIWALILFNSSLIPHVGCGCGERLSQAYSFQS